jgi:hypothetical protein
MTGNGFLLFFLLLSLLLYVITAHIWTRFLRHKGVSCLLKIIAPRRRYAVLYGLAGSHSAGVIVACVGAPKQASAHEKAGLVNGRRVLAAPVKPRGARLLGRALPTAAAAAAGAAAAGAAAAAKK